MNSYSKLMLAASLSLTTGVSSAADVVPYFNHHAALNGYNATLSSKAFDNAVAKKQSASPAQRIAQHFASKISGELHLISQNIQGEQSVIKYQQSYLGYDIWDRQVAIILDRQGKIEQGYGNFLTGVDKDLPKLPMINKAQQNAELDQYINVHFGDEERIFRNKSAELVIYLDDTNTARFAHKLTFFTDVVNGKSRPQKVLAFVDAINGEQLAQHDVLHRADVGGSGPSGNTKQAWPDYDANGAQNNPPTTFIVNKHDGETTSTCFFDALNVETRNYNHGLTAVNDPFSYDCTTSTENLYKDFNTAKSALNDAHRNAQLTSFMYQDYLGQEPFNGQKMIQNVHYGQQMDQAFYEDGQMYYGDGDFLFYPMVALDVVAHEIAHGFTEEVGTGSTKVMLTGQARAINEAFSDISGAAAEFYLRGTNDWQSNYESFVPTGEALRYMDEPKTDGVSIDHVDQYESTTEAHHGAGVFNKAFHRLITMDMGNGNENPWDTKLAFTLFANANKNCWIATSLYEHAADCVMRRVWTVKSKVNAASNTSWRTKELQNHVRKAFAQVGVDLEVNQGLESDFSYDRSFLTLGFHADSRKNGVEIDSLSDSADWTYQWNFGHDNATSTDANPSHTFPASGDYKVTLTTTAPDGSSDTYSVYVTVAADYCPTQGLNFDKYYIQSVSINGVAKNSAGSGYSDYSNVAVPVLNGTEFDVSIVAGQPDSSKDKTKNFYLWIDRDQDGLFDAATELEYTGSAKDQVSTKVSVAGSEGTTFQVRAMASFSLLNKACGDFTWGEAEDYSIKIDANSAPPAMNVSATAGVNIVNFNNATNDARIAKWEWYFGDSSSLSNDKSPSHQYAKSGTYNVTLKAYDNDNQQIGLWSDNVNFTTTTTPLFTPVIDGKQVRVDADASIMPLGSAVEWDFGDNITSHLDSTTHLYQNDGTYTIKLTITNQDNPNGNKFVEHQVQIGQVDYTPAFDFDITTVGDGSFNVAFNNNSTTPDNLHRYYKNASISWNFGDNSAQGPTTSSDFGLDTSHTYSAEGVYTVNLSISYTNSDGEPEVAMVSHDVTLQGPTPVEYCAAAGDTAYEHIASVNFAGHGVMTNTTGSTDVVNPNNPIPLTVDGTNSYVINSSELFSENYHVWIDMNGDGLFGDGDWRNDKAERVVAVFDHVAGTFDEGSGSVSGNFTLPAEKFVSGQTITTRMRVMQYYSSTSTSTIDPCSNYAASGNGEGGEIEDYIVTITKQ
jgi:vibriolysin